MQPLDSSDSLAVVGIYLTLVGLIGSFFYIHVGEWYRDVRALVAAWSFCSGQGTAELREAARHCKHELVRLGLDSILPAFVPVVAFIAMISYLAFRLIADQPAASGEWRGVKVAWFAFLVAFGLTSLVLLILGSVHLRRLRREMEKPDDA